MSEAYDYTQYGNIADGDILIVDDGVGVMVEAWPVIVVGESTIFHKAAPDFHEDSGNKYLDSFTVANQPLDQLLNVAIPVSMD
jgi:hypothetical protein